MLARLRGAAIKAAMRSDRIVRWMAAPRQTGVDVDLDPQIAAICEYKRRMKLPDLDQMDVAGARAYSDAQLGIAEIPPAPMAQVIDTFAGFDRIPVRIHVPHGASNNWLVWIHGGGGVIGSLAGAESHVRHLADQTKCTVASIDYRLGPEHRQPAGLEDICAASQALCERVPAGGKVVIGGDSYGGYASVMMEHDARKTGARRPDLQLLIYPFVDWTMSFPSTERNAEGYLLTRTTMSWFRAHYLQRDDDDERRELSPWFWDEAELEGAAPAIVATAGYDPLVDEGDAWAQRLSAAGVTVRHRRYNGLVHGFLSLGGVVRSARRAFDEVCADVVEMLA